MIQTAQKRISYKKEYESLNEFEKKQQERNARRESTRPLQLETQASTPYTPKPSCSCTCS